MGKLLKHLKGSMGSVFLIFLLLVAQVYTDLSLPAYTSDIVDIGIQQAGIEHAVPETMRPETLQSIGLFLTEEQLAFVSSQYTLNAEGYLALDDVHGDVLTELEGAFSIPITVLGAGVSAGLVDVQAIEAGFASGLVTKEQILAQAEASLASVGASNESLVKQAAIEFIKREYEACGVDLGSVQTRYLIRTGAKMLGYTLISVAAAVGVGYLGSRLAASIGKKLRQQLFAKVLSFSNADIEKFSTASLITRSTNDIQGVVMAIVMMVRIVFYAPMMGIGGAIRITTTNTGMGWIIITAVCILLALFGILLTVAMPKFKKMQVLIDRVNLVAREVLSGLLVIRAFSREGHERTRLNKASKDVSQTQLFTSRVMSITMPLMMFLMNLTMVAIIWFGARDINIGNLQVGDMLAFMNYAMQIIMSFLMLAMVTIFLPRSLVAAGRIDEVLALTPSISDSSSLKDDQLSDCKGVVVFDDVSFHYPDAEENVLNHISFTAKPGQVTAIIGSTGSGKSTLLHLIPRFFDITDGKITIDGIDIRDISQHKLHSLLGYVPQKGVLFSGDIRSNIKFGGEDITDADMIKAAEIAQASAFIDEKEGAYDSPIAQGGSNVSGGQKQRLSIARALAKHAKILLFDDSFSALDYKTDVTLRRALSENVKGATVFIVAQRINTILHADQIIVLHEGRSVGVGTHAQLMDSCEIYQEIARSQLSEEELKGGMGA